MTPIERRTGCIKAWAESCEQIAEYEAILAMRVVTFGKVPN